MGCFSFMCQKCGKPILSDSFSGDPVELFLLENGEVVDKMSGQYNSYGEVFAEDLKSSIKWKRYWTHGYPKIVEEPDSTPACDLVNDSDIANGIAAIHTACYSGEIPTESSAHDPNQGWGSEDDDEEDDGDVCGYCRTDLCWTCGGCPECGECDCYDEDEDDEEDDA